MDIRHPSTILLAFALCSFPAAADARDRHPAYRVEVIKRGLEQPAGIAVRHPGLLYFTQLPTPGIPGAQGGRNTVSALDVRSGLVTTIASGEPEPTHIALDHRGDLYWACKSAGVILTNAGGSISLVLGGLQSPSGIAIAPRRFDAQLYFTQVPQPGVAGGSNGVFALAEDGTVETLHLGEPEPTDIVADRHGNLYWTCKSAGVILRQSEGETVTLLSGLDKPQGIALDHGGNLYFTEVPTPGVPGSMGGRNQVWKYDLRRGRLILVDAGDPQPEDVTSTPDGVLFWTCRSAGVIVRATPRHRN